MVTSRSQVRASSATRMRSVFGPSASLTSYDKASRYNEKMVAFNRAVRSATQAVPMTPKSTSGFSIKKRAESPASARSSLGGVTEWRRLREQTERLRKLETPSSYFEKKRLSFNGIEVEKIIANLNRVKSLLESSP